MTLLIIYLPRCNEIKGVKEKPDWILTLRGKCFLESKTLEADLSGINVIIHIYHNKWNGYHEQK